MAPTLTGTAVQAAAPGARGQLAAAIARAVAEVPGVDRLTPGGGIAAATHHAGGTVAGVVLAFDRVEVHVVVDRLPLQPVADAVHAAARRALRESGDTPFSAAVVIVCVDDLVLVEPAVPVERPAAPVTGARVRVAR